MSGRRRKGLTPSLFPFLAVLVCTLGTLILLLALVAQNAATAAVAEAESRAQEELEAETPVPPEPPTNPDGSPKLTQSQAKLLISEGAFRVDQLVSVRNMQTADIERRREQMTQVESHMKRIREELKRLNREVELATGGENAESVDASALDSLQRKLQAEKEAVARLRKEVDEQKPRIAIVPHKGPNGTDRRPIYLECTAKGLTIWPEGSSISLDQLEESVRGANPLDAALRVVRHHALQNYGDAIAPYPMLIVRPDGIEAYAAARLSLRDWDDQFGYELVPADTELAYARPDTVLKRYVDEAIRAAVIQQYGLNALAHRASSNFDANATPSRKTFPRLSAAAMDRNGRASGFDDHRDPGARASYGSQQNSGMNYQDHRSSGTGSDVARRLDQQIREAAEALQRSESGASTANNPYAISDLDPADALLLGAPDQNSGTGKTTLGTGGSDSAGDGIGKSSQQQSGPKQPDASKSEAAHEMSSSDGAVNNPYLSPIVPRDAAVKSVRNPFADQTSSAYDSQSRQGDTDGGEANVLNAPINQTSGRPGGQAEVATRQGSSATGSLSTPQAQPSSAANVGSSHRAGSMSAQSNRPSQGDSDQRPQASSQQGSQNLSATREIVKRGGANWALPRDVAMSRGNAIVRTIRVQCYPDRMVLRGSARGGATEIFGLSDGDMNRATLELASAIRDRIERWGAAIPGGRWQPLLDVDVMSGGEQRFQHLQRLMLGSGIDIERRSN